MQTRSFAFIPSEYPSKVSHAEGLNTARLLFEIAGLVFEHYLENDDLTRLAVEIEDGGRAIEKFYTAGRKWIGNNGGHKKRY